MTKPRPVLIHGEWKSDELPHEKCQIGNYTYYFAKTPIGDYSVHEASASGAGYGGDSIVFLMTDGTKEIVRGPYNCNGCYCNGQHAMIAKHLNRPEIAIEATMLRIEHHLFSPNKEILHEETEWTLGDWRKRVPEQFRTKDYEIRIMTVCGLQYRRGNNLEN